MPQKTSSESGAKASEKSCAPVNKETSPGLTVTTGNTMPRDVLMKAPKAQIVDEMLTVPSGRVRFVLDVDNSTSRGQSIITLMNRLSSKDAGAVKAVSEILAALADLAAAGTSSNS